ncbi:MAG: hypothetical protein WC689_03750 [Methylocystis sp.]|jgi:phage terminase Nu1 subunit (DNA packaging protein)
MAAMGDKLPTLRLGIGKAARALRISPQRVAQLVDEGVVFRDADGLTEYRKVVWDYMERSREKSAGRALQDADELRRQRMRLARAADSAERRNAIAAGKYVLADEVERRWSNQLSTIRSFVMSIPTRAAAVIPNLSAMTVGRSTT